MRASAFLLPKIGNSLSENREFCFRFWGKSLDKTQPLFAEDHRAAIEAYFEGVRYPLLKENKVDAAK